MCERQAMDWFLSLYALCAQSQTCPGTLRVFQGPQPLGGAMTPAGALGLGASESGRAVKCPLCLHISKGATLQGVVAQKGRLGDAGCGWVSPH